MAQLIKKLRAKLGARSLAYRAPDDIRSILIQQKPDFKTRLSGGVYEFLILFLKNESDAAIYLPKALEVIEDDSVFWIALPKSVDDEETLVKLHKVIKKVLKSNYLPTSEASVTSDWKAVRYKHKSKIKRENLPEAQVNKKRVSGTAKVKSEQRGVKIDKKSTAKGS